MAHTHADRDRRGLAAAVLDDDGSVMLIAIACMVILFILVTMLLSFSAGATAAASREQYAQKTLHIADAGLNAYLYELRRDSNYWSANPTIGPVVSSDGTWTVSAAKSGEFLVVRSTGEAMGAARARTIVSKVAFPTFADYTMLANCEIRIGVDANIYGKVHSNSTFNGSGGNYAVYNQGKIWPVGGIPGSGEIYAVGAIYGAPSPSRNENGLAGRHAGVPVVDFAKVTTDIAAIRDRATTSGTRFYVPGTNGVPTGLGYRLKLSGTTYTLDLVKTGSKTQGGLTYTLNYRTGNIPATGVFYFDGDVWVQGSYASMVTVASGNDIYICQNITPTSTIAKKTCGLIAAKNIWIPDNYPTAEMPDALIIQAALLAMDGECGAVLNSALTPWRLRTSATFIGSRAYKLPGGLVLVDSSGKELLGFNNRVYNYDANLDSNPPPMFPIIKTGALKIVTWTER